PGEALVLQVHLEVAVASRVHVVVADEVPRADRACLLRPDRPVREKAVAVFVVEAGVVDVAEVDDVLLQPVVEALHQHLAHLGGYASGPRDTAAPVADQEQPDVAAELAADGLVDERLLSLPAPDPLGDEA